MNEKSSPQRRHGFTELSMSDLGLPPELGSLTRDISSRTGRALRVFSLPIGGSNGVAMAATGADWIMLDSSLFSCPEQLVRVAACTVAQLLHPGWRRLCVGDHDELEEFGSDLGPQLLGDLPADLRAAQPIAERALCNILAA